MLSQYDANFSLTFSRGFTGYLTTYFLNVTSLIGQFMELFINKTRVNSISI